MKLEWQCKSFEELSNEELYKIIQLRIEVFAVEQNVVYQDCDNKDYKSYHLTGMLKDQLIAYCRIIPPNISYAESASIGRVVTSPAIRGNAIGKELFEKSLEHLYNLFGNVPVVLSAQLYLVKFYENFGFMPQGNRYLEDSIPHIAMVKNF